MTDVYYTKIKEDTRVNAEKLEQIIRKTRFTDKIRQNDTIAIKTNLKDVQNKGVLPREYITKIADILDEKQAKPFLFDTQPAYPVPDDQQYKYNINIKQKISKDREVEVEINGEIFKTAKLSEEIYNTDQIIILTLFKPHHMAGLGGAIKTLGLDTASANGKTEQYRTAAPFIAKIGCLACKECIYKCPHETITLNSTALINYENCTACNYCVRICPTGTIKINRIKSDIFNRAICEYASATIKNRKNNILYINFLEDVRVDYEHTGENKRKIIRDTAILAGYDAVSLDQATYDMLNNSEGLKDSDLKKSYNEKEDKIKGIWNTIDAQVQLDTAEKLKLGSKEYKLIQV